MLAVGTVAAFAQQTPTTHLVDQTVTVNEIRAEQQEPPCDLESFGPASPEQQAPYTRRSAEWLAALTRGEEPLIDQSPRDRPRADDRHRGLVAMVGQG